MQATKGEEVLQCGKAAAADDPTKGEDKSHEDAFCPYQMMLDREAQIDALARDHGVGVSFSFLPRSMRNVKSWLTVPGREGGSQGRHQMAREGGLGRADGLARQAEAGQAGLFIQAWYTRLAGQACKPGRPGQPGQPG